MFLWYDITIKENTRKMKKMNSFFLSAVLLGVVASTPINAAVQTPPEGNADMVEDFESYANTAGLQAAWVPDQYDKTGRISSYTLNTDHTKYMEINANLGQSPYYDIMTRNLNGVDWVGKATMQIDYRGASGTSIEKLGVEILKATDWSQKWQSETWDYPNDDAWHTKTIDISGCPWLNNVGPVRVVVKAKDYGLTRVGIDNIKVISGNPVTVGFLDVP